MRKRKIVRKTISGILFLLLLAGCGADGESSSDQRAKPAVKPARADDPQWVRAIREGGMLESVDHAEIEAWLAKNLDEKTTRKDVLAVFGGPGNSDSGWPFDLDRPERDSVTVYQYRLRCGGHANWTFIVFHFDAKTGLLTDSGLTKLFCGYCPHVFAYGDRWRLEGKMLAGCVGEMRKGTDILVLPRLEARGGRLLVKLSNLAPEIDYVTQASLASVGLDGREHLDVSVSGRLVVWRSQEEIPLALPRAVNGASELTVNVDPAAGNDVVVLEVRNTAAFEAEMRQVFLAGKREDRKTTLTVGLAGDESVEIQPVGTKFLRRVVVPLPERTGGITLKSPGDFWFTRRLWIGKQADRKCAVIWRRPVDAKAIRLAPMEDAVLEFPAGREREKRGKNSAKRVGYALRIQGYYDFVKNR